MPDTPDPADAAAAREQRRLAQALHDTVSQSLTAAYFAAKVIEKKLQDGNPITGQEVADLCETIHGAGRELHELTQRLREEV